MLPPETHDHFAQAVGEKLLQQQWSLATAESCTGGGVAELITCVPGSSRWFERGFVTYSNLSKQELLGVDEKLLSKYGAVSEEVVQAMVEGALKYSPADCALAVTGIAGPDGGTKDKPVGTVFFAWQARNRAMEIAMHQFTGDRIQVREQSVQTALKGLLGYLKALAEV